MPIISDLSVLEAFDSVYNNIHALKEAGPNRTSISLMYLMELYELTPASAEVVAYLLHFHPNKVSQSKLSILTQNRDESFDEVIKGLKDRRFVDVIGLTGGAVFCYSVTNKAYSAFQKCKKYGQPFFEDCVKELASCRNSEIFGEKWLQRFNYSLSLAGNAQLKTACEKLGIMDFPDNMQKTFWVLAANFARRFTDTLKSDDITIPPSANTDKEIGKLSKQGLATVVPVEEESQTHGEYILSLEAAQTLFQGREELIRYDEVAKYATVIKASNLKKKELFFSDEAEEEIDHLRTMLSQEGYERAKQILLKKKRAPSIQSLLWGPPGTGKTESVKQLALESGRDIIQFDMSKVTGYGWGTTEKCYRALFRAYNYIAAISKNIPILLLNEADAILSKRLGNIERAIDKSENTVTNILLEELENLNGILLATTNNIDILDEAFDRRFLFKTELTKPDEAARAKIWKSSIPELSDEEAKTLAVSFDMSGAQINNVVTKRDLAELYYTGDRGLLYIERLCIAELSTEKGSNNKRRIGF